ncbi:MAG: NDP-sugar synthase [Blastocatellia bacterium]|nr:NDP-sugar synthase [Blastocatellia bacterium]
MRAIVFATGYAPALTSLNERHDSVSLPLLDRPFLQHVLENLVDQGVTGFDFTLSRKPEFFESLFGTGTRWGSSFRYHLARDPEFPYRAARAIEVYFKQNPDEPVLVGHGDRLPLLRLAELRAGAGEIVMWYEAATDEAPKWTGWALVPARLLAEFPVQTDETGLEEFLRNQPAAPQLQTVAACLDFRTYEGILKSHWDAVAKVIPNLLVSGREVEPGIWLSRNVSLHPTAQLKAPVYIGENCRIEAGVQLGPQAMIGQNSVLDTHCSVTGSAVLPGSFVGEGLELNEVIVDKNRLVSIRFGVGVTVADDFMLGTLAQNPITSWLQRTLSQLTGLALLLLSWPLLLLTALVLKIVRRGKPVWYVTEVVKLPAAGPELDWKTFKLVSFTPDRRGTGWFSDLFLRLLPGLLNIAKGEAGFVGVQPRTKEELAGLPTDWQALLRQSKPGFITDCMVRYGNHPTPDEQFSSETFYAASATWWQDLRLMAGFVGKLFLPSLPTERENERVSERG